MSGAERSQGAKQPEIESALAEINRRLEGAFDDQDAQIDRPIILVVGHQRSGTTLVCQYLASRFAVGYASNLVARFYLAPVAGMLLERSLGQHLGPIASSFRSELGTTESVREPHEFSYFWNHWFPESRRCLDESAFVRVIANMQRVADAPLLFKNVFNSLRVAELAALLPSAVFVRVRRDFLDVACSTLDSRRHRFGTDDAWFGVEPDQRAELEGLPPAAQIAAQIHHTEAALAPDIAQLPAERLIDVPYEAFCADPHAVSDSLAGLLQDRALPAADDAGELPGEFTVRHASESHADAEALRAALEDYFSASEIAQGRRDTA